jgi:hypothetical protein
MQYIWEQDADKNVWGPRAGSNTRVRELYERCTDSVRVISLRVVGRTRMHIKFW